MPATPTATIVDNADGTVTATVSGSDSGATNTLYAVPLDHTWESPPAWENQGSRTDDGEIDADLGAGVFFWLVESALSGENVQTTPDWIQCTDSDIPAVLDQILTQIQARIISLSIADVLAADVVLNVVPDSEFIANLPRPMILVAPAGTEQHISDNTVPVNSFRVGWPIVVAPVAPANHDHSAAFRRQWLLSRERIARALVNRRFPLTGSYVCMLDPLGLPSNVLIDRAFWERNALAMPVSLFYAVNFPIGAI